MRSHIYIHLLTPEGQRYITADLPFDNGMFTLRFNLDSSSYMASTHQHKGYPILFTKLHQLILTHHKTFIHIRAEIVNGEIIYGCVNPRVTLSNAPLG